MKNETIGLNEDLLLFGGEEHHIHSFEDVEFFVPSDTIEFALDAKKRIEFRLTDDGKLDVEVFGDKTASVDEFCKWLKERFDK